VLSNIFQKESIYFIQYLQFLFLEGMWLCNVSNLKGIFKISAKIQHYLLLSAALETCIEAK